MVISFYRKEKLVFHVGNQGNLIVSNLPYQCLKLVNRKAYVRLQGGENSVGERLQLILDIGNAVLNEPNLFQYFYKSYITKNKMLVEGFDVLLQYQNYVEIKSGMNFSTKKNPLQFYLLSVEIMSMRMFEKEKFNSDFEQIKKADFENNLTDIIQLEYTEVYNQNNVFYKSNVETQGYIVYFLFTVSHELLMTFVS